jgi:hypothetical protein
MKTNMTKSLVVAAVLGLLTSTQAEDAVRMAKSQDITGKFQNGACNAFAKDLFQRYERAGKEAYHIVYHWEKMEQNGTSGNHALIVFKDEKGRFYAMDNLTWKPVWLQGETPREWVKFFSGMDVDTKVVSHVATSAARGETRLAMR